MRRRIAALLTALGLGAGLAVAVEAPAQAAYSDCLSDYVCAFDGTGGSGLLVTVFRSPGTCYNLPGSANDKADSFYNHLSNHHAVQFYDGSNCTGHLMHRAGSGGGPGPFAAGTMDNFYDAMGTFHHDRNILSSIFFNTGCVPSPCPLTKNRMG
ncbi:MAG TPA: peptidase inhibitor family I36 protein [Gemmatimonadales bacterium]|nr:peptidase inhibitor family I36 protein [Gemmatimonadales bacterium]